MKKLKLEELGRISIDEFKSSEKTALTLVLDDIRSGMNVGSMFRTADALALEKIILTGICPLPPHKEIHKTAIGATQSVDWQYEEKISDAVSKLKAKDYFIIGVEQTNSSSPLSEFDIKQIGNRPLAVVMGNEVNGIASDILPLLDVAIEIEQFGTKHSLNVAVCAGIVTWELARQIRSS